MSSTQIIQRLRRAAVAGALVVLIGTYPSTAKDEISGTGATGSPADSVNRDETLSPEVILSLRDVLLTKKLLSTKMLEKRYQMVLS